MLEMLTEAIDFQYNPLIYSRPHAVVLSLTNRCNLACPYCFHNQSDIDMSFETAVKAIQIAVTNAYIKGVIPSVTFFGGEPLLKFEDLIKPLINHFSDANIAWTITTNGVLLTEEIIDFFVKNSIDLLLSADGVKEVQDNQRPSKDGQSSFEALNNIIPYLLLKMPNVIYRSTLTKASLPFLEKTYGMVKDFGFKSFTLVANAYEEYTEEEGRMLVSFVNNQAISLIEDINKLKYPDLLFNNLLQGYTQVHEQILFPQLKAPPYTCGLGTSGIGVSPEGFFHPCQERNGDGEKGSIGNVNNGIDYDKHYKFLIHQINNYNSYVKSINSMSATNGLKLFLANSYCITRVSEGFGLSSSQLMYGKIVYTAANRIYAIHRNSINPIARKLLEGTQ